MHKLLKFITMLIMVMTLAACAAGSPTTAASSSAGQGTSAEDSSTTTETNNPIIVVTSAVNVLAENSQAHEDTGDYAWDEASVVTVSFNGSTITTSGESVTVSSRQAVITSAGTYLLSGSLIDGQLIVDTKDEDVVRLILNGVDMHSSTSAPIYIKDAHEAVILLVEDSKNTITDAADYVFAGSQETEPNAAIFSNANLTILGTGSLTVNGNYNDAISTDDGLLITDGSLTIHAADDGIRGKDYVVIQGGTITTNAQANGLKSDEDEDVTKGYILIENGVLNVTSGGDAIQAETDVLVTGGEITLTAGGGSNGDGDGVASTKGIKGTASVTIDGGAITINAADDALHSNGSLIVNGGTFTIATGDDGMHADQTLQINGGEIWINQSYEGIESAVITITAGNIHILASDDGLNVAGGSDRSGMGGWMQPGGMQDTFTYTGSQYLYVHGGSIVIDAAGDGIDVNGAIEMTGGSVLVNGPTEQMNAALDYDGGFTLTGGVLIAAGSAGMAQAPGQYSSQNALLIYFSSPQPAGSLVHIQDSAGTDILTFAPTKAYQSLVFSSPRLINGTEYVVYTGGSATGTAVDGLYQDRGYTPGTQYASQKISSTITQLGSGGMGGPGGRRPRP